MVELTPSLILQGFGGESSRLPKVLLRFFLFLLFFYFPYKPFLPFSHIVILFYLLICSLISLSPLTRKILYAYLLTPHSLIVHYDNDLNMDSRIGQGIMKRFTNLKVISTFYYQEKKSSITDTRCVITFPIWLCHVFGQKRTFLKLFILRQDKQIRIQCKLNKIL